MINRTIKTVARGFLPALLFILGFSSVSWGAEFWLRAETLTKTMPDTSVITMWGFAQCTTGFASCTPATVPGPKLTVPVGDTALTINLRNNLTGSLVEPVSIVIPGQTAVSMTPVKFTDATGRQRARSFTSETLPGNTGVYTWTNVKPGTYLYQSGSHPAVQVQMGLYGAVTKDFAAGQAYGTSTAYASEALLLFSEIDPALHAAVAGNTYGTVAYPSTFNYEPKYFLINGAPHSASSVPIPAGNAGTSVLLRFLNAGLKSHVPVIQGTYLSIVAEDGNTYPFAKQQYSMLLPPGKTTDAIFTPTANGNYALYDRRLALTNGAATGGGQLVNLGVGPGTVVPGTASKIGVYAPATAQWYLDVNGNGVWDGTPTDRVSWHGFTGVIPVTGDWSGTGTTKIGVYDPATAQWYLDYNGNGAWDGAPIDRQYWHGFTGVTPVTGDWNGDGSTDIGVYDPATAQWYLDYNGNGVWDGTPIDRQYWQGFAGIAPVTGDWNGDGRTEIGIYDPATAQWYLDYNGNGSWDGTPVDIQSWHGFTGAIPVTGRW